MSIKKIFSVLDAAANAFGSPWVLPHVGIAVRSLSDEVNNPQTQSPIYAHPQDFALYEIGSFDDVSGVITALERPTLITQAASLKTNPAYSAPVVAAPVSEIVE